MVDVAVAAAARLAAVVRIQAGVDAAGFSEGGKALVTRHAAQQLKNLKLDRELTKA